MSSAPRIAGVGAVIDASIDPYDLMLKDIDTTKGPIFEVSAMAKFFFARSPYWIRNMDLDHPEVFTFTEADGSKRRVGCRRKETKSLAAKPSRIYTLSDVEEVAHALAQNGVISGFMLRSALRLVRVQAEMHGYL